MRQLTRIENIIIEFLLAVLKVYISNVYSRQKHGEGTATPKENNDIAVQKAEVVILYTPLGSLRNHDDNGNKNVTNLHI